MGGEAHETNPVAAELGRGLPCLTIFIKALSFLPMAALFKDVLYPFLSSFDVCAP